MLAALAIARRFWPIAAALAALLALWSYGNSRYKAGVTAERTEWQAEATRLRAVAAEEAAQRAHAVIGADTAARAASATIDALSASQGTIADDYYRAHPAANRACLADDRLRAIAQADRAAIAAAAAK